MNVRWATQFEQMGNTRNTRLFTINGVTKNLTEWSKESKIDYASILERLENGWSIEDALYKPKTKPGRKPAHV